MKAKTKSKPRKLRMRSACGEVTIPYGMDFCAHVETMTNHTREVCRPMRSAFDFGPMAKPGAEVKE